MIRCSLGSCGMPSSSASFLSRPCVFCSQRDQKEEEISMGSGRNGRLPVICFADRMQTLRRECARSLWWGDSRPSVRSPTSRELLLLHV